MPPAWPQPQNPWPPAQPSQPKARKGMGLVAAVGVLLVLAVTAGIIGIGVMQAERGDTADTAEGPVHPDAWDPRIAPIAEWVADERDLPFEHPVEVVLQTEEDYLAQAAGDPTEDDEATQDMDDFVATLRALGLVHGEVDLDAATRDLNSVGTLAYYDSIAEKVFVRGDELTPSVRVTLAHELTHVLQDQHFDLDRLDDPDFAEGDGLRAMAEGDAGRIEDAYAAEVLSADERERYDAETEASIEDGDAGLAEVPPVLSILFGSPYALGEGFLAYQERVAGGEPWDELLRDPPTQEELLDPSAWGTARAELEHVSVDAPEGADILDHTTFDPLTWFLLLASRGDAGEALIAVDGWAGDDYVAYREDGRVCAAMRVVGDDAAATDRLRTALDAWAAAGPETDAGRATVTTVDGAIEVRACDPGVDAPATGDVSEDLLAVPYVRAEVESSLIETGATTEQARCASRAVLDIVPLDQLTAPTTDPALEQQITEAIAACA